MKRLWARLKEHSEDSDYSALWKVFSAMACKAGHAIFADERRLKYFHQMADQLYQPMRAFEHDEVLPLYASLLLHLDTRRNRRRPSQCEGLGNKAIALLSNYSRNPRSIPQVRHGSASIRHCPEFENRDSGTWSMSITIRVTDGCQILNNGCEEFKRHGDHFMTIHRETHRTCCDDQTIPNPGVARSRVAQSGCRRFIGRWLWLFGEGVTTRP